MEATKHCPACNQHLPLDAFSLNQHGNPRRQCRPCRSAIESARYATKANRPAWKVDHIERQKREREARRAAREYRRREMLARIDELAPLVSGASEGGPINDEEGREAVMSELQKLWLQSGDKQCAACGELVSPASMLPPGPANFYPDHCRPCARQAHEQHSLAVFGTLPEPRRLPLRDGTTITLAELASRHREREAERRALRRRRL